MEKQEKTMRPIPKNVRQIGERDEEIKLYIEDYVNTFIRKCARTDSLVVGALIGDYYLSEGKEYLFVEGAVQAENFSVADGRIRMTDEAWSGLYGKISEFFSGRSICGWFLCSGDAENCSEGMIRSFMYENIGGDKRVLIIHNGEAEEENFSVYDQNVIREKQGYYLFYERNEPMQSYMVTTAFAARTDPVAVDTVTAQMRTRMVEKKEIPAQKSGYSLVSAAALVVGVIALASGIVMMNHYDQLREMETVLTNLSGNLLNSQQSTGEESTEESGYKFAGLIIEDVNGDVSTTENQTEESQTEEDAQAGATAASGDGQAGESSSEEDDRESISAVSGENSGGNSSGASGENSQSGSSGEGDSSGNSESQNSDKSDEGDSEKGASQAGAESYRTYLVERGDTLVTICWQIYGYRDDGIIEKICEINNLVDKDHIYAGQELLIP